MTNHTNMDFIYPDYLYPRDFRAPACDFTFEYEYLRNNDWLDIRSICLAALLVFITEIIMEHFLDWLSHITTRHLTSTEDTCRGGYGGQRSPVGWATWAVSPTSFQITNTSPDPKTYYETTYWLDACLMFALTPYARGERPLPQETVLDNVLEWNPIYPSIWTDPQKGPLQRTDDTHYNLKRRAAFFQAIRDWLPRCDTDYLRLPVKCRIQYHINKTTGKYIQTVLSLYPITSDIGYPLCPMRLTPDVDIKLAECALFKTTEAQQKEVAVQTEVVDADIVWGF